MSRVKHGTSFIVSLDRPQGTRRASATRCPKHGSRGHNGWSAIQRRGHDAAYWQKVAAMRTRSGIRATQVSEPEPLPHEPVHVPAPPTSYHLLEMLQGTKGLGRVVGASFGMF